MPRHTIRAAMPGLLIAACAIVAAILLAVCASRASAEVPSIPARATGTLTVSLPASGQGASRVGRGCYRFALRAPALSDARIAPDRSVRLHAGEWYSLAFSFDASDLQAYHVNGRGLWQYRCDFPDGSLERLEWRSGRKVFARFDGITFTAPRPCIVAAWR